MTHPAPVAGAGPAGGEVRLLWTGGWDSTFRLLQLSQEGGLAVRPMYVRDHGRGSMPRELAAMRDILPEVRARAGARVLDVELYDGSAIRRDLADDEVSSAYDRLADRYSLGYQYELFALLCRGLGVRAECCVEDSARSHAKAAIDAECLLVPCGGGPLGGQARHRVVSRGGSRDAETVLGCLDLPMLGVSKVDALRMSKELGWMPVMRKTWFCHAPRGGRPCGVCGPCRDAMAEGMAWRLPPSARLRYHASRLAGRRP